jgi:hypothetical protein
VPEAGAPMLGPVARAQLRGRAWLWKSEVCQQLEQRPSKANPEAKINPRDYDRPGMDVARQAKGAPASGTALLRSVDMPLDGPRTDKDRQLAIWILFSKNARVTGTIGQTGGTGEKEL